MHRNGRGPTARGIQLLVLFVPLAVTAPFAFLAGAWDAAGVWRSRWGDLLLHTLMLAGPAFMKWGQWAAARPDIVPQDLALKLETLHMDAPTHSQVRTPSTTHRASSSPHTNPTLPCLRSSRASQRVEPGEGAHTDDDGRWYRRLRRPL
jgi:hypothetical protein